MLTQGVILLLVIALSAPTLHAFALTPKINALSRANSLAGRRLYAVPPSKVKIDVSYEETDDEASDATSSSEGDENAVPLSPEEQYKKDKLAEIAEKKAQEVFMSRSTGKYECQACGYVYNEAKGNPKKGIAPGTPFESIEKFRCPECGANKKYFVAETETVSGFKQNQKYGLGANSLTGEAKGLLIYGGLFLGFLVFLSGYLLE